MARYPRHTPKVVVVTGASSGIGRATALRLAREGYGLVLAARREGDLRRVAARCEDLGGEAIAVPTDVTDPRQVDGLAEAAVARFGRIDVWFNNAGVVLLSGFERTPAAEFRRVIETNLFGYAHGARAALRRFRAQGSGVLINTGSMLGPVPEPYAAAYVASKNGILGLSRALAAELEDAPGIRVCTLLPAAVDTPIFGNAANHTGWRPKAVPPVLDPMDVAEAVLSAIHHPREEIPVGAMARLIGLGHAVAPRLTEGVITLAGPWMQFWPARAPDTPGNLFRRTPGPGRVRGGWREVPLHTPVQFWGALAVGALGVALLGRRLARR